MDATEVAMWVVMVAGMLSEMMDDKAAEGLKWDGVSATLQSSESSL